MTSPAEKRRDNLLSQYVASFEKLDEMREFPGIYPIAGAFAISKPDDHGAVLWRPRKMDPEPELLEPIYAKLPARFPPLFERLLLTYRDYDPVCFDISSRKKGREMRVVKIDHEEILCHQKVKVVAELAPSFEALVQGTIDLANRA